MQDWVVFLIIFYLLLTMYYGKEAFLHTYSYVAPGYGLQTMTPDCGTCQKACPVDVKNDFCCQCRKHCHGSPVETQDDYDARFRVTPTLNNATTVSFSLPGWGQKTYK